MVAEQERGLVPAETLGPGLIERGFSERMLAQILATDDPVKLWVSANELAAAAQFWNGMGQEKTEIKSAQMFCEVRLGNLLGPNPGDDGKGSWANGESPHAETGIPYARIAELRRFHKWLGRLIEEIRNGARSRRSLLLKVDEWEADERTEQQGHPTVEQLDIRRGDFRLVLGDIEPGSVALVLTDPPYPAEYLPLWGDLGAWSAESLMEGGSLIAYSGHGNLFEVGDRLRPHLRYWWTLALIHGQSQMIVGKWVSAGWKPLVWFVRERRANNAMLADTVRGSGARKTIPTGDTGDWAQGVDELAPIISALTAPGDLIVDPFAGSGTVGLAAHRFGRRFIGAEIGG